MASLNNLLDPEDPANPTSTSTTVPNTSTAGSVAGTTTSGNSTAGNSGNVTGSPGPSAAPANPNQTDAAAIGKLNAGFDFSPLLSSVRGQGTAARSAIGSANDAFTSGLGAAPVFGAPQQTALDNVISGADPKLSDGSDILNYHPPTPSGINNASYDPLVAQYQTSAGQTANQSGINSLLANLRPDLTPGELNYDSTAAFQNPAFKASSQGFINDANDVANLASATTGNAGKALTQRAQDVAGYDTAGKNYVDTQFSGLNNQLTQQQAAANTYDQSVNTAYQNLLGQSNLTSAPASYFNFDPSLFQTQDIAAQQPGNPFDEKFNPNSYLTFNQGNLATPANTATAAQVQQYNNMQQLRGNPNQLSAALPRQAATIGFNANQWQQALNQAILDRNQSDIAWLAAHQPPPAPVVAEAEAPVSGGNGGGGSEGGSGGSNTYHKGGLVGSYRTGGAVAPHAGPPGVDTVPAHLNNGEYVLRAPSTAILGTDTMSALNNVNKDDPVKQANIRQALHQALSNAIPLANDDHNLIDERKVR